MYPLPRIEVSIETAFTPRGNHYVNLSLKILVDDSETKAVTWRPKLRDIVLFAKPGWDAYPEKKPRLNQIGKWQHVFKAVDGIEVYYARSGWREKWHVVRDIYLWNSSPRFQIDSWSENTLTLSKPNTFCNGMAVTYNFRRASGMITWSGTGSKIQPEAVIIFIPAPFYADDHSTRKVSVFRVFPRVTWRQGDFLELTFHNLYFDKKVVHDVIQSLSVLPQVIAKLFADGLNIPPVEPIRRTLTPADEGEEISLS